MKGPPFYRCKHVKFPITQAFVFFCKNLRLEIAKGACTKGLK